MTDKQFKDEVFSRAEKQLAKQKRIKKAIFGAAVCFAVAILALPVVFFSFSGSIKGNEGADGAPDFDHSEPLQSSSQESDASKDYVFVYYCGQDEPTEIAYGARVQIYNIAEEVAAYIVKNGKRKPESEHIKDFESGVYKIIVVADNKKIFFGAEYVFCNGLQADGLDYLEKILKIIDT